MTLARYSLGIVLAGIAFVPVCASSWALRERLLPRWTGAPARLAEVVLSLGVVITVSEMFGTVGLFRTAPIVIGLAIAGLGIWYVARRGSMPRAPLAAVQARPASSERGATLAVRRGDDCTWRIESEDSFSADSPPANRLGRGGVVVALGAIAVLAADWGSRTIAALHHGMDNIDTLWYHLPTAARFVQDGSITRLHFFAAPDPVVPFYPANSALLHGLGILLLGNDLLSPLLNLGFLGLALLAGWCVGRPFGVAPVTLTGTAVLFATPGFVATQPGGGYNDVVGLALLLSAVALLVNADWTRDRLGTADVCVAGLAAGLALGTKFTFVAPVVALTIGVVAIARKGERVRIGTAWLVIVVLGGGFWYARNLIAVGKPLPGSSFGLPNPPGPRGSTLISTVSEFLFDRDAWGKFFLPGLGKAYGPAWWALVALAVAGLALAVVVGPRRMQRMLGLVGFASAAAYVFSPQFLTVLGVPFYFVYTLRYVASATVLGLVLLPTVPAFLRQTRQWWIVGGFGLVLIATQLDPSVWPSDLFGLRFAEPIRGADSLGGVALGAAVFITGVVMLGFRSRPIAWRHQVGILAAVGLVVAFGGFALQHVYLRDRYVSAQTHLARIYEWARGLHHERIAIVGSYTKLQYPFYGTDLSNYVQYVGRKGPHGAYDPIRDCVGWRRSLNAGRYSYVITPVSDAKGPSLEAEWTTGDAGAARVRDQDNTSVFRIDRQLDPAACKTLPTHQGTVRTSAGGAGGSHGTR